MTRERNHRRYVIEFMRPAFRNLSKEFLLEWEEIEVRSGHYVSRILINVRIASRTRRNS